ncbi:Bug family tripartite tricarboxylate transporter substrate binding protein [Cupriavidus consociatus]|uniref:Bug family tripartite tricarboxylate transporter substrate binding protein n=1 Tax=Cupriavidus consociatus TaxID=2821357 RepID=UPI001AE68821|nr:MULTISPECIES: tripartite tricarboxylate transporter substrate binding protein [unclassified Cupriavidus]MBP0619689.1 tripartite tricarboxylate transporter substrate binding protein [Cupriavidus sp. LEh25]MDK2656340.1 tripartite tricarboxylate transporter substrate binding protein [Cupriavidus sp. LEh21]
MQHQPRRHFLAAMLGLACAGLSASAFAADSYPSRPIRLVVPSAAGGSPDVLLRALGAEVTKSLGQSFVIDNKPGASGVIGISELERAAPDGYTLGYANNVTLSINKSTFRKLPYRPDAFVPVVLLFKVPNVIAVNRDMPVKTFAELVAYIKANPDKVTYASPGQGTSGHLTGQLLADKARLAWMHVGYKGSPQAATDVMAGQVNVLIDNMPTILPLIQAGKLKPLAVTSLARSPLLPALPTIAESGVPGFESVAWGGLVAPQGTPPEVVGKLNGAFNRALANPAIKEKFASMGAETVGGTPQALSGYAARETDKWAAVVRQAGIMPQ